MLGRKRPFKASACGESEAVFRDAIPYRRLPGCYENNWPRPTGSNALL